MSYSIFWHGSSTSLWQYKSADDAHYDRGLEATATQIGFDVYAISETLAACFVKVGGVWQLATYEEGVGWDVKSSLAPISAVRSLTGLSQNSLWVGGQSGKIKYWDGVTVTEQEDWAVAMYDITDMQAIAVDDCWCCGSTGFGAEILVAHWDGVAWDDSYSIAGVTGVPSAIYATSTSDVWVGATVSGARKLYHYDGVAWNDLTVASGIVTAVTSISGTGTDNVFFVTAAHCTTGPIHWNGTTFTSLYPGNGKPWYDTTVAVVASPDSIGTCAVIGTDYGPTTHKLTAYGPAGVRTDITAPSTYVTNAHGYGPVVVPMTVAYPMRLPTPGLYIDEIRGIDHT